MKITPKLDESPVLSVPKEPKEMISVGMRDGKTLVRINSSSLQVIQNCMRKAHLSLDQGWVAQEESPATVFGSAVHSFLEVFYTGEPEERKLPDLEQLELMSYGHKTEGEESDLCLRAVRKFLDKHEPISSLPESDKRSSHNGVWILWHYVKAFIDDPYVAWSDESGPFLERTFSFVIYESDSIIIEIFGTIDFILQHTQTKELLPGDHKTTSFLGFGGSSYFDREKPNLQYSCYVMGVREVFNQPVENFMVNILEVKQRPKTVKGSGPKFPRQITTRNKDDLEEFKEAVIYYVEAYLRAKETGIWPMGSVDSCNLYGSCSFRPVCSSPKSMRETILNGKFQRRD